MVEIIRSEVFFSVLHFLNIDNQDFIDANFVQAKMLPVFYNQTRGSLFYFVDFSHGSTVHTYKMGFPTQTPSFWGGTNQICVKQERLTHRTNHLSPPICIRVRALDGLCWCFANPLWYVDALLIRVALGQCFAIWYREAYLITTQNVHKAFPVRNRIKQAFIARHWECDYGCFE